MLAVMLAVIGPLTAAFFVAVSAAACKPGRGAPEAVGPGGSADSAPRPAASPCKVLRDRLCARFGDGSDECRLAEEQTQTITDDRCAAMRSHVDDLATATKRLVEGRRAITAREQNTPHGPAPSIGSPGAAVTMVVFGDFDSPECARGSGIATAIKNLYGDRVRLIFRQFPLAGNPDSHLAAQASLAAHAQGEFWRYHDILFGNQQDHRRAALERYAREAGLDGRAFARALDGGEFAGDVDADRALGKKLGVAVLPALFVNGVQVRFPYAVAELAEVVAHTLATRP